MFKTARQQLGFICIALILSGFSLASIVDFTDPFAASRLTLLFFYLSLLLFDLSLFTIIGLAIRQWLWPKIFVVNLSHSFRQAFLLSLLVAASFGLLAARLLFWWVELSLVLFLLCIEILFNLKI